MNCTKRTHFISSLVFSALFIVNNFTHAIHENCDIASEGSSTGNAASSTIVHHHQGFDDSLKLLQDLERGCPDLFKGVGLYEYYAFRGEAVDFKAVIDDRDMEEEMSPVTIGGRDLEMPDSIFLDTYQDFAFLVSKVVPESYPFYDTFRVFTLPSTSEQTQVGIGTKIWGQYVGLLPVVAPEVNIDVDGQETITWKGASIRDILQVDRFYEGAHVSLSFELFEKAKALATSRDFKKVDFPIRKFVTTYAPFATEKCRVLNKMLTAIFLHIAEGVLSLDEEKAEMSRAAIVGLERIMGDGANVLPDGCFSQTLTALLDAMIDKHVNPCQDGRVTEAFQVYRDLAEEAIKKLQLDENFRLKIEGIDGAFLKKFEEVKRYAKERFSPASSESSETRLSSRHSNLTSSELEEGFFQKVID